MRKPEEIEAAMMNIAEQGHRLLKIDPEMARLALKLVQCLQWVRGADNEFGELLKQ